MVNQEHDFKVSLVDKPFNIHLYLLEKKDKIKKKSFLDIDDNGQNVVLVFRHLQ